MSEKPGAGWTDPADVDWDGEYSPLLIWQEIHGKIIHWMMEAVEDERGGRVRRPPPQLSRRALTYLAFVASGLQPMTVDRRDPREYYRRELGLTNAKPPEISASDAAKLAPIVLGLTREDGLNAFEKYWSEHRKMSVAESLEWARDQGLSQRQQQDMIAGRYGISDWRTVRRYAAEMRERFPPLTKEEEAADRASMLPWETDPPKEGQT